MPMSFLAGVGVAVSYNMVISLAGRVSLFSRNDIMFSTCMAITRHNSRPCSRKQKMTESNEKKIKIKNKLEI